ncbi:MAG: hypothetical protein LW825_01115 [Candidatus Jidaibacter sp.]|jgi:glutaredoxin|nr:hypothetical protein [Candidatus Jidaibacter sp.]
MNKSLNIVVLIVAVAGILFSLLGSSEAVYRQDLRATKVNLSFLVDETGAPFKIESRSIIHVFGHNCSYCVKDKKLLAKLGLKDKVDLVGLEVLDDEHALSSPLDSNVYSRIAIAQNYRFFMELGATGIPVTLIVGKNGNIIYSKLGALDNFIIENEIIPIIDAK